MSLPRGSRAAGETAGGNPRSSLAQAGREENTTAGNNLEELLMYLRSRLLTEFLSDEQLQRIVDAAIRIWRHVPLRVQGTDEFLGLLRDLG